MEKKLRMGMAGGEPNTPGACKFPAVGNGFSGMKCIHNTIESCEKGSVWVKM